jgi:hypothetical protein
LRRRSGSSTRTPRTSSPPGRRSGGRCWRDSTRSS